MQFTPETIAAINNQYPSIADVIQLLRTIRRLPPNLVRPYIVNEWPAVPEHVITDLIAKASETIIQPRQDVPVNTFDAAAWLAGASWRQIAVVRGITPQGAYSNGNRLLPYDTETRHNLRKAFSWSIDAVRTMKEAWDSLIIAGQPVGDIISVSTYLFNAANAAHKPTQNQMTARMHAAFDPSQSSLSAQPSTAPKDNAPSDDSLEPESRLIGESITD